MKKTIIILSAIILTACATPITTLQNDKGQTVSCGGSSAASVGGGVIGYHLQKAEDRQCVTNFSAMGFKIVSSEE